MASLTSGCSAAGAQLAKAQHDLPLCSLTQSLTLKPVDKPSRCLPAQLPGTGSASGSHAGCGGGGLLGQHACPAPRFSLDPSTASSFPAPGPWRLRWPQAAARLAAQGGHCSQSAFSSHLLASEGSMGGGEPFTAWQSPQLFCVLGLPLFTRCGAMDCRSCSGPGIRIVIGKSKEGRVAHRILLFQSLSPLRAGEAGRGGRERKQHGTMLCLFHTAGKRPRAKEFRQPLEAGKHRKFSLGASHDEPALPAL